MGVLRSAVEKADATPGMAAEIKETLHLLSELCESRANEFETLISKGLRTAGTTENPTVPVTLTLAAFREIRVITQKTPNGDILKGITSGLKSALTGSSDGVINGIAKLVDTGLEVLLGAGDGREHYKHTYYVATDGLSIVRLDLILASRTITAKSITEYAEKSLVCVAAKSSVNLAKVDFNVFLSIYQSQLDRCDFSRNELKKELDNAREIYDSLVPKRNQVVDEPASLTLLPGDVIVEGALDLGPRWP